jgi:hypothetical protein
MIVTKDGWLQGEPNGPRVVRYPTIRTTPLAPPAPRALVWHATGGVGGPRFAEGLARRIQTYRRGVDRAASWHILIARKSGDIYQSAPITMGTWHVGKPGTIAGVFYPHINNVSIGVEIENAGPLVHVGGAYYAHPFWLDATKRIPDPHCRVPIERVRAFEGRRYDTFTEAQTATAAELVAALANHLRWSAAEFMHCHAEFGAPLKTDPGPLWMKVFLPRVLSDVFTGDGPTIVTGPPDFTPSNEERRAS